MRYLEYFFIALTFIGIAYPLELKKIDFLDVSFVYVEIKDPIKLQHFWIDSETGNAYGSISNLFEQLKEKSQNLVFAINSGIFSKEHKPLGWCIEKGKLCQPINLTRPQNSVGNFSLLPNGVFFVEKNGNAKVLETESFMERRAEFEPYYATQSGPMLVINGQIHPRFLQNSDSLKYRSGVCVKEGIVYFAVNETPINFYNFAQFFKEKLGCHNALYLDGTLSQLYNEGSFYGAPFWNIRPYVGIWGVIK